MIPKVPTKRLEFFKRLSRVKTTLCQTLSICSAVYFFGLSSVHGEQRYFGVNLAGADFGVGQDGALPGVPFPGTVNIQYIYPNQAEVDYFKDQQMNTVRLPFRWERIQRSLNGNLDNAELNRLKTFVDATTAKGVFVLLDPHNYARYNGQVIGTSAVPNAAFADFWTRIANEFKDNPRVIFGLMNEPSRMPTVQWRVAANIAIQAIRDTDADNLILVPGNGFTGGHSWLINFYNQGNENTQQIGPNGYRVGSNAEEMLNIVDPGNNFAFDIHQYLDGDFSGTQSFCQSTTIGSESLQDVTNWLAEHNRRAFLGEFGGGSSPTCLSALEDMTRFMDERPDQWIGWAYWAAGPWWGDYFSSLEPINLNSSNPIDRPQLASLIFNQSVAPNIPGVQLSLSRNELSVPSEIGFNYQVQTSTTLAPPNWINHGNLVSGTGNVLTLPLPAQVENETERFYRIEISR